MRLRCCMATSPPGKAETWRVLRAAGGKQVVLPSAQVGVGNAWSPACQLKPTND